MGRHDTDDKYDEKLTSTEKKQTKDSPDRQPKAPKQHGDYSRLESGENARISPDDLSELISEGDVDKLKQYGGVKGVAGALGTDLERGLSEGDLENKKQTYGENRPHKQPQKGFLHFVWDALQDKTLIILSICAGISIVLGVTVVSQEERKTGWIDGTAILAAVVIVVMVTACNDFSKDKKFRKLSELREEKEITVIREGQHKQISAYDVLVGDVLELEAGAPIPADGLYISGQNVSSDESAMTGESDSVHKNDEEPFLLSGCTIVEGVCRMLVVAVGERSQKGKISALLQGPNEDTPLTKKLEHLSNQIGKFGLVAAVLVLAILIIKYVVVFIQENRTWQWSELGILVQYLIEAITIVVVAVPEGLPLAVTISLAYSMMKMMKDQNLVRHLEACETMGGATCICSDKTGTLTENKMTVAKIWLFGQEIEGDSNGNGDEKSSNTMGGEGKSTKATGDAKSPKDLGDEKASTLFAEGVAVNSSAYIETKGDKQEFVGNKTECALLLYLSSKMNANYEEIRQKNKSNIVKLYPFSSESKMMSTVVRAEEGKYRVYCKGASEMVLEKCSKMMDGKGEAELDHKRDELTKLIEDYASQGLRTIAFAYKDFSEEPGEEDNVVHDLTFIGLAGIKDPVRKEVPEAVKKCKKAGIFVRMITGDNILTARHIAKECGILTEDGIAIEGPKFRKMSTAEIDKILPKLQVIARAAPTDKYILVHRLRELGEVVAVTGDGVNDAPQLKEADVGFAMGITGTEVAKEASDIVLLDDNFSSIVRAVMWGRNVYDSIRKFIQFQLTVNVVAVAVAFIGAVTAGESPLTPVQLLWVNLIMDTFAALALATERPTEELLDRKPYGRYDNLITRAMWRNIISQAIFQLGVLLFMLYAIHLVPFAGISEGEDLERNTFLFNTFVMCQLFNEVNSRKLGNKLNVFSRFFANPIFLIVMSITLVGQFLLVEFAGSFASTTPLNPVQWAISVAIGAISIPYGMLVRTVIRPKEPESKKPTPEEIQKMKEKEEKKSKKKGKEEEEKDNLGEIGQQIGKIKKGKGKKEEDLEAGRGEEEEEGKEKRKEKGKEAKGKEPVVPRHTPPPRPRGQQPSEKSPLLAEGKSPAPKGRREPWDIAGDVVTQVSVVNALRNQRRRSSAWSYPTRKSGEDVRLARHRRLSRQLPRATYSHHNNVNIPRTINE